MLKTWQLGEKAENIKAIIEHNFKTLGKHLKNNVLVLSTAERESLSNDYLSVGLIVYDTSLNKWLKYNGKEWLECVYVINFTESDWTDNGTDYEISVPYSNHLISTPHIQLYLRNTRINWTLVLGGVNIDSNDNITLSSDMPFKGKVVIK